MLSAVSESMLKAGAWLSTVMVREVLPVLPLRSVTEAVIATAPSGRFPIAAAGTVRLQEPSACTVVVKLCPARVTVTVCPVSAC
ncbi:hypothetical protein VEE03_33340 [Escherichia coli]|nr:hypothetical protein VEE03_33340 [Escherichia coli]